MTVTVGEKAPDFKLSNQNGEQVSLEDFTGKYVVLYFYPKDMTPGCTNEACDFRDAHDSFSDLDAVILGVSGDPADSHQKFIDKHDLPFQLLADTDHQVAAAYDVQKSGGGIERSTFIIDKAGVVKKEFRAVKVDGHVDEALQSIRDEQ